MAAMQQQADVIYSDRLFRRNRLTWLGSGLVALGLNLALSLVIPYLMDPAPPLESVDTMVPQINLVRIKPVEKKIKRELKTKPPAKPPKTTTAHFKRPQAMLKQPPKTRLSLPFEINPKLPDGPHSLPLSFSAFAPTMAPNPGLPEFVPEGQLDAPLTTIARIPPLYPARARRLGIEGWVKVAFVVDKSGRVKDLKVVEAQPPKFFEKSVLACVKNWRYKPGTVTGMPVETRVSTLVRFELRDNDE